MAVGWSMVVNPLCIHWFVIPVALCGVLTGADVVAWVRREMDTFDPKAIIGILWFHGTCLSPLLHVSFGAYSEFFDSQVDDWPMWFGRMGTASLAGLVLYKLAQRYFYRRSRPGSRIWIVNDRLFFPSLVGAITISAAAAAIIFVRFGALHKEAGFVLAGEEEMVHVSWLLMLGDPLPLLVLVGLLCFLSDQRRRSAAVIVGMLLLALLSAQFLLTGMRGSRSAVIYVLFLGTALCHYRLRRISVTWILVGAMSLGVGAYYYKYFKRFGSVGIEALSDTEYRQTLSARSGISPLAFLLGDLARADIQTFLMYRLVEHGDDYRLRWGKTYVFATLMFIPRAIWPTKPSGVHGKVGAGTDLQFGEGSYHPIRRKSSRVYGLAGEAMLNFGIPGVLLVYPVFGALLGWYRRKIDGLHPEDARFLLVPVFTMLAFIATVGDADNTVFAFLKYGGLLTALVFVSCDRRSAVGSTVA